MKLVQYGTALIHMGAGRPARSVGVG